jgi:D-glycero-beta-D-manno-heptose-7-phosphate kinase
MIDDLPRLLNAFKGSHIVVIGDVVLDEYVFGTATRMSREAPVPVLEFTERKLIPGGAANPAVNLAALGANVALVGVTGDDAAGEELRAALAGYGINVDGLLVDPSRPTTVKQRVMAQMGLRFPQQMARIDRLLRAPVPDETARTLADRICRDLTQGPVLFSDYQNGLLTESLIGAIRQEAGKYTDDAAPLLAADAQGDFMKYVGFGLVKCNAGEAATFLRRPLVTDSDFAAAAIELRRTLDLTRGMVITRGPEGATAAGADDNAVHVPSPKVEDVFDTVGAGDTAIAVLTLAVSTGASLTDAVRLANLSSGVVVRHVGNYAPTPEDLLNAAGE